MAGGESTYLQGCDMFQLNGAIFNLLAHTHHSWLDHFAGLQNEHLKKRKKLNSSFAFNWFQQNYYFFFL